MNLVRQCFISQYLLECVMDNWGSARFAMHGAIHQLCNSTLEVVRAKDHILLMTYKYRQVYDIRISLGSFVGDSHNTKSIPLDDVSRRCAASILLAYDPCEAELLAGLAPLRAAEPLDNADLVGLLLASCACA